MFKIVPNPTFWAPVALTAKGEPAPVMVDVEFKHLERDALQDFFDRCHGGLRAKDALQEVVVNWRGFDEAYSADALDRLLKNNVPSAQEIFSAYRRESVESRVKN